RPRSRGSWRAPRTRSSEATQSSTWSPHTASTSSASQAPRVALSGDGLTALNALDRHLALVGFMGAGKSTLGPVLATRLGRRFVSLDGEIERSTRARIPEIFASRGEAEFRSLEEAAARDVLARSEPLVLELGGGALGSAETRRALEEKAFVALLDVDPDEAWRRVANSDRPLAADPGRFRALYEERDPVYAAAADCRSTDPDGVILAA